MRQILILDEKEDNVAVALLGIRRGETISIKKDGQRLEFTALNFIPAGHKISLVAIKMGQPVIKYGYPIGKAVRDICQGELVHIDNLKSMRGKELIRTQF